MKKQILFLMLFALSFVKLNATNYYFSTSGDNAFSGQSIEEAWKSIDRLKSTTLSPGDSVLLKRGDVFIGQLEINHSGTKEKSIYVGAFGDANLAAPHLTGATSIPSWTLLPLQSKLYYCTVKQPVKQLYLNSRLLDLARYPNSPAMLTAAWGLAIGTLKEAGTSTLTQANDYWKGTTVRFRSINWTWEYAQVTGFSNQTLNFTTDVRYAMESGFKFYIENKREQLDAPDEWYYDQTLQQLLYYPTNAASIQNLNLKAVLYDYGVLFKSGVSYVHVSNLMISKYAESGIMASGTNKYIEINNCGVRDIEKIGIKFFLKSTDNKVNGCFISDVRGRGISFTESSRNTISNNVIRRIGLIPGHGTTGVNGCEGITVELYDETRNEKFDRYDSIANHNVVYHNIVDSTGYIGIRLDGQFNTAERNIIEHSMITLDDGGALYCYNRLTKGSRLANNFVLNSAAQGSISIGIYVDNSVYNFDVRENTISKISGSAITINAEAHDNYVTNNIAFDNGSGLWFSDWATIPITGNKVFKNTFVSMKSDASVIVFASNKGRYENMAVSDSNYYVNPYSDKLFKYQWNRNESFNFATWRTYSPTNDSHSVAVTNLPDTETVVLFTNKTDSVRTVNLTGCACNDLDNNAINQLVLAPFSSKVLRKTDKSKCTTLIADPPHSVPFYNWPTPQSEAGILADNSVFGIVSNIDNPKLVKDISIYPNPIKAGEKLYFKNLASETSTTVELTDLQGKMIFVCNNPQNNPFVMPTVKQGMYILVLKTKTAKTCFRLAVE